MNTTDLLGFIVALLIGALTAYLAKGRGRNPPIWFFIGTAFGIFGLIGLFLFPIVRAGEKTDTGSNEEMGERGTSQISKDSTSKDNRSLILPPAEQWFYLDSMHKQHGPHSFSELESLWRQHTIGPESYVWHEGMNEWKKIGHDEVLGRLFTTEK